MKLIICLVFWAIALFSSEAEASIDCSNVRCPPKPCPHAVVIPNVNVMCCPTYKCIPCNGSVLQSGEIYAVDSCTSCTCERGTLVCTKQVCPEIDCDINHVPTVLPGTCCKTCVPNSAGAMSRVSDHLKPRECIEGTMRTGRCKRCWCIDGKFHCVYDATVRCHPPLISANSAAAQPPMESRECVEGRMKPRPCQRCWCLDGKLRCVHDRTQCGRRLYSPSSDLTKKQTNSRVHHEPFPKPRECIEGAMRAGRCKRCWCIDGKFHCVYDATVRCRPPLISAAAQPPIESGECVEGRMKPRPCQRCWCLDGKFRCVHDRTQCGRRLYSPSSNLTKRQTNSQDSMIIKEPFPRLGKCVKGSMKFKDCTRCWCITGEKFSCVFDETLCVRHRRSLANKDSAGDDDNTSFSAAQNIHALSNIGSAMIAVTMAVSTLH